jgi:hypothetical protein
MNSCGFLIALSRAIMAFVVVFSMTPFASAQWKERVLYSFQGIPDGAYPAGDVVFDQAGNLYGTTEYGGANDCPGITQCGTVFQLQPPAVKGDKWKENVLYIFKGVKANDGDSPAGGILLDKAGNIYGTTAYGGSGDCKLFGSRSGCGTVFELLPPKQEGGKWAEKVLYSFKGGKDGYFPWGDLTSDSAGNLYGATEYGGGYGSCNAPYYQYCGTVFEVSPPKTDGGKWTEKVLYAFKSGTDGANPNGGLIFDSKGAIYGTTYYGGDTVDHCNSGDGFVGCGTVFQLTPSTMNAPWTEKILLHFKTDASMGGNPAAGVIFGPDGDLYGTTYWGGEAVSPAGTIFKLHSKAGHSSSESVLYNFTTEKADGYNPLGGLSVDNNGKLYGTTSRGGSSFYGTVFGLAPPTGHKQTWDYSVLYSFTHFPDPEMPQSSLAFDKSGNLYGTAVYGGSGNQCQGHCGAVFVLQP